MIRQLLIRNYLVKKFFMNNISDKNLIIILFGTIIIVFALIFSVKSPERKVIDSPIMWKEEFSTIFFFKNDLVELKNPISYNSKSIK